VSITIHISGFGHGEVLTGRPCPFCATDSCQPGWCEDGMEIDLLPDGPEAHISNDNAKAMFATLGIPWEPAGELAVHELPEIIATVEAGLGDDADGMLVRAPMLREPMEAPGRGARVICFGASDEQARERLCRVLAVLRAAAERGLGVQWE
jgi:hypothetical protein